MNTDISFILAAPALADRTAAAGTPRSTVPQPPGAAREYGRKSIISLATLGALLTLMAVQAQTTNSVNPRFDHPLTLAPADAGAVGGGAAADQAALEAELVRRSLNPVASLVSVPIQNNWDFGIGPASAMRYTVDFQPIIPFTLTKDLNLITRTILPMIYQESLFAGDRSHFGLGDTLQSFFLSPKEPVGGWRLGGGPALQYPSATDSALGSGQWGAGPTIVALRQEKGFTYGLLAHHLWSYAGWGDREVNATFLQPFVGYTTKTFTTFMVNSESTYDWQGKQWSVPVNFMLTQVLQVGKQPLSLQLGYRYYAEGPSGGPDWGLRFAVTFLFLK